MTLKKLSNSDDRFIGLQEALEGRFLHLIDHAVIAGWSRLEAIAALAELADNAMLAEISNGETERAIREARKATKQ